ncbi:hypothetical protein Syun_027058 [Stephania yunnanensis]|uniref:Cysteine-rich receptor-like protein kinase 10 n=1 Tax=Stephania yunnanensis TaxID=152371 RepID=A0AAP0EJZ6_9MAGN
MSISSPTIDQNVQLPLFSSKPNNSITKYNNQTLMAHLLSSLFATTTLILSSTLICTAQTNNYLYHFCGSTGNFTSNGAYATNLNQLFSSLSSNATTSSNGYQNMTFGRDPDKIYGAFMCRGDVSSQSCKACVDFATSSLISRCPNSKESIIWFDNCMLRYSNQSFFSSMQTLPSFYVWNPPNASDPNFNRVLGDLMNSLVVEAINGGGSASSRVMFKTKQAVLNGFQNIYGLVQCTPDLSPGECDSCLTSAIGDIPTCCDRKQGGRVVFPSCNLRFEVYRFYADPTKNYLYHHCGETETDRVYGAITCRGDIEIQLCKLCVDSAMPDLTQFCPWQKESLIWYEYCMLRYSNKMFFSVVQTSPPVPLLNAQNTSDPEGFYQVLEALMRSLTTAATTRRYPEALFAADERKFSDNQIYGLVQCTGDLSSSDCSFCLGALVAQLSTCCKRPTGGSLILPSCYLKYDVRPFYESRTVALYPPPPPSLMNSTPPKVYTPRARLVASVWKDILFTALLKYRRLSMLGDSGKGEVGKTIKLILIPAALTIGVLLIGALCCFIHRRKFKRPKKRGALVGTRFKSSTSHEFQNGPEVNCFSLTSILAATDCFSAVNKLGEGGFGPVYQGTLLDGLEIAVKRLSKNSGQGLEEFMNEVTVIAKLQHKNLVRLLDPSKRANLDWKLRYHIIEGIAQGILYLHKYSRLRIIHRDLKASNILLDDSMNPKISDFGMARIFGGNQTEANTGRVVGTYGYMSPEYALNGLFSEKSDVFSFGVLLIEIISSKRNTGLYPTGESPTLLGYAWELWKEGKALELMDESIRESHVPPEVLKCIQIGLLCIQEDPAARPTMSSIVSMFGNYSSTLPLPKHPEEEIGNGDSVKLYGLVQCTGYLSGKMCKKCLD